MKKMLLILFFFNLLLAGCKKNEADVDVTSERGLGALQTPDSIMDLIPDVDTTELFAERIAQWTPPPSFSLDMPPIKSQGGEGSCVAFAAGYAARSYHLHRDAGNTYTNGGVLDQTVIFSPEYIYNKIKLPGDCNAGTYVYKALDLLKTQGVCTWQSMPYSSINGCTTQSNSTQNNNAAIFKINSYYRVGDLGLIKRILYSKNPVIIAARIDDGFWRDGKFVWNGRRGNDVGGHAMVICGWDDSKQAYKVMNSWGTGWGYSGFGWIGYDYLDNVLHGRPGNYEIYVMKTSPLNGSGLIGITTNSLTNLTATSVTSGGNISFNATPSIIKRGISRYKRLNIGIGSIIYDNVFIDAVGTGLGTYTLTADSLTPNTTYYVRAFAKTGWGTFYGNAISFTTPSVVTPTLPVITTTVSSITTTSALSGGNVTSDGNAAVTERGVCYSTTPNPTTASYKRIDSSGGTGSFSSLLNLQCDTRYYVRAYAINSVGTAYGNEISFITEPPGCGSVTDIDGNVYQTVTIGTQCWMKENLRTTRYRNGITIPNVTDSLAWENDSTGAYCYFENNSSYNAVNGKLYNGYVVNSNKNVCPAGWHIPTQAEWNTLYNSIVNIIGVGYMAGSAMKQRTLWDNSTGNFGNNCSGFTGVPTGYRKSNCINCNGFFGMGQSTYFWSKTESVCCGGIIENFVAGLVYNSDNIYYGNESKKQGYSIRCIKD